MPNLEKKSQPSESEIKEFWERCGFKLGGIPDFPNDKYTTTVYWIDPDGQPTDIPFQPIDLSSLFKYAVPKLRYPDIDIDLSFTDGRCMITIQEFDKIPILPISQVIDKDPALALFWAIQKLIGGNNGR